MLRIAPHRSRRWLVQALVRWSAAADDGGGDLTKYVVIASTAYADINVEAITSVHPTEDVGEGEGGEGEGEDEAAGGGVAAGEAMLPTEATVVGLTNGLVYSFQVVAANAFGYSTRSLPSNKVWMGWDGRDGLEWHGTRWDTMEHSFF